MIFILTRRFNFVPGEHEQLICACTSNGTTISNRGAENKHLKPIGVSNKWRLTEFCDMMFWQSESVS